MKKPAPFLKASRLGGSDHLLLYHASAPPRSAKGDDFFRNNWSLGWMNFLFQEAGSFSHAPLEQFDFGKARDYRFIYLPHCTKKKLSGPGRSALLAFVEAGGTLVLEGPAVHDFDGIPLKFQEGEHRLRKITRLAPGICHEALGKILLAMPFETRGWGMEAAGKDAECLLEMENKPVLFRAGRGGGRFVVLGFDFGLLLTALQQGVPVHGKARLQKLFGRQTRVIEPEDLVLKAEFLDNPFPYADLFERFLFQIITRDQPSARWWYFPGTYTGAVVSTHDEEALGTDPRIEAMQKEEECRGVEGTWFIISDSKLKERWRPNGQSGLLSSPGRPEIGLHWNRFEKYRLKIRRFKFGMHEEPLSRQIHYLEKETGGKIRLNRTHYLALGADYGDHFKLLQNQGIYFDSTYGPNQGGKGYLFGTAYPFFGLLWKGEMSGVLELPFVVQETWGKADLRWFQKLVEESHETYHQCLVMNFHPHYTVLSDAGRAFWLGTLDAGAAKRQWMPALGEFFEFVSARATHEFKSTWSGNKDLLEIACRVVRKECTLAAPFRLANGKNCAMIRLDGVPQPLIKLSNAWLEELLIPVPEGEHKVEIHYAE